MPITFGSVGDIISVCLIVKDLVDLLSKTRGASDQHESLIHELWILDRGLLEVALFSRTHSMTTELFALCETARQAVEKCRFAVEAFTKRIKRYEDSLRHSGGSASGYMVKRLAMKTKWQISEKNEIEKFRAEVAGHSASINMLLATASVLVISIEISVLRKEADACVTER
jgi:hypothetical protein